MSSEDSYVPTELSDEYIEDFLDEEDEDELEEFEEDEEVEETGDQYSYDNPSNDFTPLSDEDLENEDDGLDELSREFVASLVDKIMSFMKLLVGHDLHPYHLLLHVQDG